MDIFKLGFIYRFKYYIIFTITIINIFLFFISSMDQLCGEKQTFFESLFYKFLTYMDYIVSTFILKNHNEMIMFSPSPLISIVLY